MGAFLSDLRSPVKLAAVAALMIVCAWLIWNNLLSPARPGTNNSPLANTALRAGSDSQRGRSQRSADPLADLDPTLREDLLAAARSVEYRGTARNIFQAYAPPPPPPAAVPAPPVSTGPQTTAPPPPPPIPLKFYGTAQESGLQPRKAFLTEGEEIFIAQEGDVVAKSYKVIRIAPTMIELVDTRSNQRAQLPLIEE